MTHRSKLFASRCPTAGAGCAIAAATGVASVAAPALSKVRRAGEIGSSIVSSPYVRMLILRILLIFASTAANPGPPHLYQNLRDFHSQTPAIAHFVQRRQSIWAKSPAALS